MSDADSEAVRRAVEGDAESLSELLRRHGPTVEQTLRIEKTLARTARSIRRHAGHVN